MGGFILLIAAAVGATPTFQARVYTVDGHILSAGIDGISNNSVSFNRVSDTSGKYYSATDLPLEKVLTIEPETFSALSSEKPVAWIELLDGSKLAATEFSADSENANLELGSGKEITIPTATIRRVRFVRKSYSDVWPTNVDADVTSDLLAVRKKDRLDFMEGTVGKVDENYVIFKVDGENYPISRSKVEGLAYFHKAADGFPSPICIVETTMGSRLKATGLTSSLSPNREELLGLSVTTVCGAKIDTLPWEIVAKIDFSIGKVAYLSDLEPASIQWTPYLDFGNAAPALADYYAPRRDEGREHQPLQLAGKKYDKGLSLYSRTAIDYRVPAGMKKFKATAGIDDAVREAGNVRLTISADGKKLFDQSITGKDAPAELDLDLAGAKRLSILLDYGDQFDAGDYLDLAEARMLK